MSKVDMVEVVHYRKMELMRAVDLFVVVWYWKLRWLPTESCKTQDRIFFVDNQNEKMVVRVKFEMSRVGKRAGDGFLYGRQDGPDQPMLQDSTLIFFLDNRNEKMMV